MHIAFESQTHCVREGNRGKQAWRLSREAERFVHGHTIMKRWSWLFEPLAQYSSLFLPQASTLRPRILSSFGCLATSAQSRNPHSAVGIRPQAPGRSAPEKAKAGIRLGKGGEDWRRLGCRGGLRSV